MAGYVPNRSPSTRLERIGTFYGQTSDDWREINEAQDIDTYFITAGVRAFAPVSYHPSPFKIPADKLAREESTTISSLAVPVLASILPVLRVQRRYNWHVHPYGQATAILP